MKAAFINPERIFPDISTEMYDLQEEHFRYKVIYRLYQTSTLDSWKKKNINLFNTSQERLEQIFFFHKKALQAEINAKYLRADFFWGKTYKLFFRLNDEVFQHFSNELSTFGKDVLTKELLLDTHLAFIKGIFHFSSEKIKNSRIEKHLGYIEELLSHLPLKKEKSMDFFSLNWAKLKIEHALNKDHISDAILTIRQAIKKFPHETSFVKKANNLEINRAIESINEKNNINESQLLKAVKSLEKLRTDIPKEKLIYEHLGNYYSILMSLQAKAGNFCDALLSLRKAVIYYPNIVNYDEWWTALSEQLNMITSEHAQKLLAKTKYGQYQLTTTGELIIRNYRIGYSLVENFIKTEEKDLIKEEETAALYQFCLNLGITQNQLDENWEESAVKLNEWISAVLKQEPKNQENAKTLLQSSITGIYSGAVKPDLEQASKFVMSIINKVPLSKKEESFNLDWIPCLLKPKQFSMKRSSEPFMPWLFSQNNLLSKAVFFAAAILLLTLGFFDIQQSNARNKRDVAYQSALMAIEKGEDLSALSQHIEDFLAHPSKYGKDRRLNDLEELFNTKFGEWFMDAEQIDEEKIDYYQKIYNKMH